MPPLTTASLRLSKRCHGTAPQKAFTLIELLVVVTIIVVLLALLLPAMDRAMYQADLAMCETRQRAIGVGIVGYATENLGAYPNIRVTADWQPTKLWLYDPANNVNIDNRLILRKAINLQWLNDPLGKTLDMEAPGRDPTKTATTYTLHAPYAMWIGWPETHRSCIRIAWLMVTPPASACAAPGPGRVVS